MKTPITHDVACKLTGKDRCINELHTKEEWSKEELAQLSVVLANYQRKC